jgi:4-diphosphocytidyl-2-C-methyl-D-erythritol kinase
MTSSGFAPAKINLTLHVTGQRIDGYHLLDSLVVFADVGDKLRFTPNNALSINVTGPFAQGVPNDARNLVWQAAERAGWTGHIDLEKNLPHGAGIGGGSSDTAAVLRALGGAEHAATLGADVPVCLNPQAQRMRGIGEQLNSLPDLPPLWAVLANPNEAVPTPPVFQALSQKNNAPMADSLPRFTSAQALARWLQETRNDLQAPAITVAPIIENVLAVLSQTNPLFARMSGSGATCFALYETQGTAQTAAQRLIAVHPNWWIRPCRLS